MKFITLFLFLIITIHTMIYADIIENPDLSKDNKKHKTLILKEIMTIRDLSNDYYFQYPDKIKISKDGDIFVRDNKELLKFDQKGKFYANFFKYGQGPEEIIYLTNFIINGKELILHDSGQSKVVIFDHQSKKLIKEIKLPFHSYHELFYGLDNTLFFTTSKINDTGGKLKIVDIDMSLVSFNMEDGKLEDKISFPIKYLTIKTGDRFFTSKRSKFLSCPISDHLVYISHTAEYNILCYDFKSNSITKNFKRKYDRVEVDDDSKKYAPGGNFGKIGLGNGEMFEVPIDKFHLDIQKLLFYKNNLLVITSTITNQKEVLIDVYDMNGKYIDCFYIKYPPYVIPYRIDSWIECIDGDFLYTVESDEEEQKYIRKYKIEGWE